tara:strand:- start:3066 stop:3725 length:660 start_codon:yes stop_codon:yes gene_type:complete
MDVKEFDLLGTRAFQIDNFYDNAGFIMDMILSGPPNQVITEHPKHGDEFFDLRHHREEPTLKKYTDQVVELLDDTNFYVYKENGVDVLDTNFMRWKKSDFNNYQDNYWFPHLDAGWVCIIYLNEDETNGTNIYEDKNGSIYKYGGRKTEEDRHPWKPKTDFEIVNYLTPKFNRGFLFDASKIPHGAAVDDETYFYYEGQNKSTKHRLNQALFFFPRGSQ